MVELDNTVVRRVAVRRYGEAAKVIAMFHSAMGALGPRPIGRAIEELGERVMCAEESLVLWGKVLKADGEEAAEAQRLASALALPDGVSEAYARALGQAQRQFLADIGRAP
jgi:hypothetical protein